MEDTLDSRKEGPQKTFKNSIIRANYLDPMCTILREDVAVRQNFSISLF